MTGWMTGLIAALPLGGITIRVREGKATAVRGRVRRCLAADLGKLARDHGVRHACIHARSAGSGVYKVRVFGFPPELHQRVRNVWSVNQR